MEPRGRNRWQSVANRFGAEAAKTSQDPCQRPVGMEPSGQNAVFKRDDFARSASTRGVARGDGSTCRARAPLGSAPTSDLKGRRRKLKDIDARKRAAHQRLELAVHRSRWFVGLRCCRGEGHQRTNRADGFHGRRGVANPSGYPSLRKPPGEALSTAPGDVERRPVFTACSSRQRVLRIHFGRDRDGPALRRLKSDSCTRATATPPGCQAAGSSSRYLGPRSHSRREHSSARSRRQSARRAGECRSRTASMSQHPPHADTRRWPQRSDPTRRRCRACGSPLLFGPQRTARGRGWSRLSRRLLCSAGCTHPRTPQPRQSRKHSGSRSGTGQC